MPSRRKLVVVAAVPAALVMLGLASYDYVEGAAFVIQAAGMQGPVRTVAEWTTTDIAEWDTTIPWRAGALRARVYRPVSSGRPEPPASLDAPPALVVPGVHAGGIDEPRLVQFARDVASMGRIVVAAELSDLKLYRITPQTTDMIEDAAGWLSTSSGFADDGKIGLMGISFAGGLSIVAASRPSLRDRVAFVMSFGGHGDLPRTLRYLCTGRMPDGSSGRPPHDYGVAIILLGVADRVVPPEQVAPLREAILAFLNASHIDMWDKPQAQVEFARAKVMAQSLPEPARTFMGYVNTRDVTTLGPLLLPHVTEMGNDEALSPARSTPTFPVYLLHGTDDNVIPAVESELLEQTYRSRSVDVTQLATPLITHAEVDRSAAARAIWDLVRFWANLLEEE
jgi:dienelactone hydrolase